MTPYFATSTIGSEYSKQPTIHECTEGFSLDSSTMVKSVIAKLGGFKILKVCKIHTRGLSLFIVQYLSHVFALFLEDSESV